MRGDVPLPLSLPERICGGVPLSLSLSLSRGGGGGGDLSRSLPGGGGGDLDADLILPPRVYEGDRLLLLSASGDLPPPPLLGGGSEESRLEGPGPSGLVSITYASLSLSLPPSLIPRGGGDGDRPLPPPGGPRRGGES